MLPVDTLVDEGGETRIGRQGVLEGDGIRHPGTEALERIARGHLTAIEVQFLDHRRFAQAMRVNTHYAQERHAPWKRESQNVSSDETTELLFRPTQASPGRLRAGQLRTSFLEHGATLRQQLRIFSFPHRQVGAGVDDGERAIANVRFQPTKLRLGHSQGDQHDAIGLLQIWAKLFKSQARRGAILGTIFQQLTIVITYVAGHVI